MPGAIKEEERTIWQLGTSRFTTVGPTATSTSLPGIPVHATVELLPVRVGDRLRRAGLLGAKGSA